MVISSALAIILPALVLFLTIGVSLVKPLYAIVMMRGNKTMADVAAQSVLGILETPVMPDPASVEHPEGSTVEFRDVAFSYGEGNAVEGVSFIAEQGRITVIVGPSGAGKSTVANLISRLWDVDSGSITIGGADVRNIPPEELHRTVSSVFQKPYIFADTVHNNIAMAREGATDEEVRAAAEKAMCGGFIAGLPNGYQTLIGEGGIPLSGGERQRISIARAMLKDAPIILLDEATASLDPENEQQVQRAIGELTRSKTVVVIAHRLKTVMNADSIFVLDSGRMVESGTHEELINAGGRYKDMWDSQLESKGWRIV